MTTEELANGLFQALRLVAVGLAFAVYALLLDHDRLLASAGWARRSTVAVGLATRLVPLLERDARDHASRAARPRGRAQRDAPALAAPRRLARARAQSRRGDGGARLRTRRPHACAAQSVDLARPARARRVGRSSSSWGRCGCSASSTASASPTAPARRCSTTCRWRSATASTSPCSARPGRGKSTLLRALAGLVPHFHGGTVLRLASSSAGSTRARPVRAARGHRRLGVPGPGGPDRDGAGRRTRSPSASRTPARPRRRSGRGWRTRSQLVGVERARQPPDRRALRRRAAARVARVGARAAAAAPAARRADLAARP